MDRPRPRELALFSMLGALMFSAKMVLAALPNIEPVSLMTAALAAVLGPWAAYPVYLYVLLEIAVFGPQLWSLCYLYVWELLALAAWRLRGMESAFGWALLTGGFGLLFGALCAPAYLVTGGPAAAIGWWISGIPFDLLHCAGNFALTLALFRPLRRLTERLWRRFQRE